jgi:hypothetical protein
MADFEITAPNGKVYHVQGPDGLNDAQAKAYALNFLSAQTGKRYLDPTLRRDLPGKAPPHEQTWAEFGKAAPGVLWDSTKNITAGIGEGIGALPDLAVRGMGNVMGWTADLFGAPEWVSSSLEHPVTIGGAIEKVVPVPENTIGRYNRAAARGVGGAVGGQGAGKVLEGSANATTRAIGALLGQNRGAQYTAGVIGSEAAQGAADLGAPPLVQFGVGLAAGGFAPSAGVGVGTLAERLATRVAGQRASLEDGAAGWLRGNTTLPEPVVAQRLRQAAPVQASGARPTLAEVTLDPGHAAAQRGVGNVSPRQGARISERLASNAQQRLRAVDQTFGRGNPDDIATAATARERALSNATAAAVDRVGPQVAPDVAGADARGAVREGYQAARARTSDAYGHPLLNEDPQVRLSPLERPDVEVPAAGDGRGLQGFQDQAIRASRGAIGVPAPRSLLQFVRSKGGIAADDNYAGDFAAEGMGSRGQPTLLSSGGRPLDELREVAVEAGYVPEDTTLAGFAEMLSDEYRGIGAPRVAADDLEQAAARDQAMQERDWWRSQFDRRGLDPLRMSDEDWSRFYNDVEGGGGAQPRSRVDLEREPAQGRLMGALQQSAAAIRQRFFGDGGAEAAAPVRGLFDDILGSDEVGLKTLEGWERRARDLASQTNDRTSAAALRATAEAIGARAAIEGGPERRAALDAARGVRREQGEVFESGSVGRALRREQFGRDAIPDSAVGRTLVPPGRAGGEAADQLSRAAGNSAEGIARTELRRALDAAGGDPRALARVARDYGETASRFPSLAADIREARNSAALSARFRQSRLGKFLDPGTDPAEAVSRLMTVRDGGNAFRALVEGPGMGPSALAGVRRGVAEHIKRTSMSSAVDANLQAIPITRKMADGLVETLERTKGTSVLAQPQRGALNAIRRELRADQFARSANRPSGSDTARNLGTAFKMLERVSALPGGGGGIRTIVSFLLQHTSRTDDIMDLVTQAIEDPKFAAQLLQKPTPDRVKRVIEAAQAFHSGSALGAGTTANN